MTKRIKLMDCSVNLNGRVYPRNELRRIIRQVGTYGQIDLFKGKPCGDKFWQPSLTDRIGYLDNFDYFFGAIYCDVHINPYLTEYTSLYLETYIVPAVSASADVRGQNIVMRNVKLLFAYTSINSAMKTARKLKEGKNVAETGRMV